MKYFSGHHHDVSKIITQVRKSLIEVSNTIVLIHMYAITVRG